MISGDRGSYPYVTLMSDRMIVGAALLAATAALLPAVNAMSGSITVAGKS